MTTEPTQAAFDELLAINSRLSAHNKELREIVARALLNTRNDAIIFERVGILMDYEETQWWKDATAVLAKDDLWKPTP